MINKVQVLHGHTSPETAFVVDDYPYGYSLRCKIRYWVETAERGAKKGQQRFMSQTTNPKVAGEVWNKPKGSTYALMVVMYLDENGHVQWWGASEYSVNPAEDARIRLMGIFDGMEPADRAIWVKWVDGSRAYYQVNEDRQARDPWAQFDRILDMLADHIREHGTDPELPNGVYVEPSGRTHWIGAEYIRPVFLTLARQRAGVAESTG